MSTSHVPSQVACCLEGFESWLEDVVLGKLREPGRRFYHHLSVSIHASNLDIAMATERRKNRFFAQMGYLYYSVPSVLRICTTSTTATLSLVLPSIFMPSSNAFPKHNSLGSWEFCLSFIINLQGKREPS